MRGFVTEAKLRRFMEEIGNRATSPGVVYLVGGSTALLLGIREKTIDIDVKLDPEPGGVFQAIAELKDSLGVNVELAAPDQFIPPLPGWKERSGFVDQVGNVVFRNYDLYSQVLAKIERGHEKDLKDAEAMMRSGDLLPDELSRLWQLIRPDLIRYPAVDAAVLDQKVTAFLEALRS